MREIVHRPSIDAGPRVISESGLGGTRTLNQRLKRDGGESCYGLTDASYADGVLAVEKFTPQESEQSFGALASGHESPGNSA